MDTGEESCSSLFLWLTGHYSGPHGKIKDGGLLSQTRNKRTALPLAPIYAKQSHLCPAWDMDTTTRDVAFPDTLPSVEPELDFARSKWVPARDLSSDPLLSGIFQNLKWKTDV